MHKTLFEYKLLKNANILWYFYFYIKSFIKTLTPYAQTCMNKGITEGLLWV